MTNQGITRGQAICVQHNKGKKVKVQLLTDIMELYIQDGTIFQGQFRYVMSKAKNPRKDYQHGDMFMHDNIDAHYYAVHPMRIIV